jgi:hypothetical protein
VEAIYYEDDTPEQWKDFYTANVDFFSEAYRYRYLTSRGGRSNMGAICALPSDRTVANLPMRVPSVMKAFHTASVISSAMLVTVRGDVPKALMKTADTAA